MNELRYQVRDRNGLVIATFMHAGAARRMMAHENDWAERSGQRGSQPKYHVYDTLDKVTMTWGEKR